MGISSYRDLKVWQEAMQLAELAYRLTARYVLTWRKRKKLRRF